MSDLKSKIPDLSEIGNMAGKLFKDVKKSVCEIADEYKAKHKKTATPKAKAKAPQAAAKKKEDK